MGWTKAAAMVLLAFCAVTAAPESARSDAPSAGAPDADDAVSFYNEGLRLLQQGKVAEALATLDESMKRLPSPNTDLLRAHALRQLGRRVEAMTTYERVVRDAGARVRAGDSRFDPTLADAGSWIAFLRSEIGEIRVEVHVGPERISVYVDGRAIEVSYDRAAGMARARLWHEPGNADVGVRATSGIERKTSAEVSAGSIRTVSMDVAMAPAPPKSHVPPAASWIAWGGSAVGFAVLAIFGSMASSAMVELDACRPHCDPDLADSTKAKATLANVGLGFGIAGAVTGAGIWIFSEAHRSSDSRRSSTSTSKPAPP